MPARKLKPIEANDGSYGGRVLAAYDALVDAPGPCTCPTCADLDRAHPHEGFQLRLLPGALADGPDQPARPTDPDAPADATAGVSETPGPPKSRLALAASTDRSNPDMTKTSTKAKPAAKKTAKATTADAPAHIVPTAIETVPLGRLKRAPENVRHTNIDEDAESLADDIAAHGLLQSLIGYRGDTAIEKDAVWIAGGGRRLQALGILADRFLIDLDFPVPVLIRDREEAVELSLSENLARRDMNPADEFVAFATLMAPGTRSPADLAKRFGFSERYVKQRLKLATLAPEILDALRAGEMTLQAALAYGRAADQEVQRKVFKAQSKRGYDKHGVDRVRYAIDSENKSTDWPLYRYVGAEAYERAGGTYEDADLFGDADTETPAPRRIVDGATVIRLAHEHIDFQMIRRLTEMAEELDLDRAQLAGFVKLPDLEFGQYTMLYNLSPDKHAPDGYVFVGRDYDYDGRVDRMLKTIRNNRILVQVPVGIDSKGELVRFTKGFYVPRDQKAAIDPPAAQQPAPKPMTQEEIDAAHRAKAVDRIAWRRGVGKFAGTPFEGRAFYPARSGWIQEIDDPTDERRGTGKLVTIQIWVTNEQAAAERAAAEQDYDAELRAEAERRERAEREREERDAELAKREEALRAMEPPAVVVIDGEAWARDTDGAYATLDEIEDGYIESWPELLDHFGVAAIGDTFTTRADFDAAMATAAEANEAPAEEAMA